MAPRELNIHRALDRKLPTQSYATGSLVNTLTTQTLCQVLMYKSYNAVFGSFKTCV